SPGRGFRVVTDTENQISGLLWRSSATTVLFPTPEGPESTVSLECAWAATPAPTGLCMPEGSCSPVAAPDSDIGTELLLKCCSLVGTETTDAPRFGDAEPFHDLLGAN